MLVSSIFVEWVFVVSLLHFQTSATISLERAWVYLHIEGMSSQRRECWDLRATLWMLENRAVHSSWMTQGSWSLRCYCWTASCASTDIAFLSDCWAAVRLSAKLTSRDLPPLQFSLLFARSPLIWEETRAFHLRSVLREISQYTQAESECCCCWCCQVFLEFAEPTNSQMSKH